METIALIGQTSDSLYRPLTATTPRSHQPWRRVESTSAVTSLLHASVAMSRASLVTGALYLCRQADPASTATSRPHIGDDEPNPPRRSPVHFIDESSPSTTSPMTSLAISVALGLGLFEKLLDGYKVLSQKTRRTLHQWRVFMSDF